MAVDLDAIARRGRCEVAQLKLAQPLLEQGYAPPFLARYRRDELGGIDEPTLWALKTAVDAEQTMVAFRDELHQAWEKTPLADPAIGNAIRNSHSRRTLERLRRRLKSETAEGSGADAHRLSVRILNPKKGDGADFAAIAESMDEIQDKAAAVSGLESALKQRLAGDPRVISAAVRWLSKHAKIHIATVSDPHLDQNDDQESKTAPKKAAENADPKDSTPKDSAEKDSKPENPTPENPVAQEATTGDEQSGDATAGNTDTQNAETQNAETEDTGTQNQSSDAASDQGNPVVADVVESTEVNANRTDDVATPSEDVVAHEAVPTDSGPSDAASEDATEKTGVQADDSAGSKVNETADAETQNVAETSGVAETPNAAEPNVAKPKGKKAAKEPKKTKKISPRQRRRRWLVSVLKPLAGKRFSSSKLSAFQIVMLGRGLRSQVAVCSFEYDASKMVAELQRMVAGINRSAESQLSEIVLRNEAHLREAAEAAWWDELHERASSRLVGIASEHLRRQVNRGTVDAKVVMSIDAVGPRTAATAIVSADGRVLHGEDLPCQLQSNLRSQAVAKMGELIHQYNVDLVVISNGPSRRACIVSLGDLIAQSPDRSVHWTLADRSGADAYAGSEISNAEMRSTPRRFRAAAWLAFSILHPAQAYAKIDPLKLRLASFQSELSEDALSLALESVMTSGASRGGVDANSAPVTWLQRLPGMSESLATALDQRRRQRLLQSRGELLELDGWQTVVQSRQAMPFLRVFGSEEVLDGTLIHPDDYALAKKLAGALEIELPPTSPPGYTPPSYETPAAANEPALVDATEPKKPAEVEDFSEAGSKAAEFKIEESSGTDDAAPVAEPPAVETESNQESTSEPPGDDQDSTETTATEIATTDTTTEEAEVGEPQAEETGEPVNESVDAESADTDSADTDDSTPPAAVRRPLPEKAKIEKCIKEWQVGKHRVNQLVQWLCDPFGENLVTESPPAVLTTMPSLKALKAGDQVVGVVVGVMPFGVFLELAPDCSGLIHVSKISDGFVEDLHEAVQVGDVLTAWVTGTDDKRRRVALSALSPEQEAAMESERQLRRDESRGGRHHGGGRGRGGKQGSGGRSGGQARSGGGQTAGQSRGGQGSSGPGSGGQGRGGQSRGGQGQGGQGRGGQSRGGQSHSGKGGRGGQNRDRRAGRSGPRQPESYRVVAKEEQKPLTDAMQKGDEPLRSFGDLMQFMSGPKEKEVTPKEPSNETQPAEGKQPANETPKPESTEASAAADAPVTQDNSPAQSEPVQQDTVSSTPTTPTSETAAAEASSGETSPADVSVSDEQPKDGSD